ncbi:hypothetical protein KP509_31G015700 [Ceratopteris richardii]|uniref:Dof-type domain-containing protein n=1 Tax=Ceratopteris richardii TaxID=49495 RepID=A0A8T2QWE2_CERRI|nr:hypothetical protein KP509_31G015700 [Ceratopteris richardii]KAH7288176.1 hypothetical protein KP509_31G015700 [Ceratopteris richardii]KAH7288177.1 hypothetical protein KP509_31G015700 [Ceratopteris richardii]
MAGRSSSLHHPGLLLAKSDPSGGFDPAAESVGSYSSSQIPSNLASVETISNAGSLGVTPASAQVESFFTPALLVTAPSSATSADQRRPSSKAPHPNEILKCPRCDSLDTKFCYYNNYSHTQPRYFCKNCKRYWTAGGALRNVPVGGGLRKNKRSKMKMSAASTSDGEAAVVAKDTQGRSSIPQLEHENRSEPTQTVDIRTSASFNAAMPSRFVLGIPELNVYNHVPSATVSSCYVGGEDSRKPLPQYTVEHAGDQGKNVKSSIQTHLHLHGGSLSGEDGTVDHVIYNDPVKMLQIFSSHPTSLPTQFTNGEPSITHPPIYSAGIPASDPKAEEVKQEKHGELQASHYDWHLISDVLFHGGGLSDNNYLYTPSSGWLDLSQFSYPGPA